MAERWKRGFAKFCYGFLKAYIKVAYRTRITYTDPNRKTPFYGEPVIFVGNHTSHMDGAMSFVELDSNRAHILVAKDWFEQKKFNWFLKYNRCIPTDRRGIDTGWMRDACQVLKDGGSVIMYPEGKTGTEPVPQEFKPGFVMLALMSKVKIVPFAIDGEYKVLFGKRQRLILGEPMELSTAGKAMSPVYMNTESERFRRIIIEMRQKTKERNEK